MGPNEDIVQPEDVAPKQAEVLSVNTTMRMAHPLALGSVNDGQMIFHQKDAPPELRLISQAPNTPLAANPGYTYSIDGSEETFIYDIGWGINRAHWDFSNPSRKIEWLYTPQTRLHHHDTPTELTYPWPRNFGRHSTCTASKAAGMVAGAAKHATLVVVKFWPSRAGAAEVFETIMQDIVTKRRTHHSVVSYSYGSYTNRSDDQKMASDIMMIVRRGVPVILAAGNNGPGFVTRLPASIADRKDNLWGPIVVGAVDNNGNKAPSSEELRYGRMLWAPGVDIECANTSPDISSYITETGTSFAAPLVAGVVAEQLTEMNRRGLFHPTLRNKFIYENLQWKRPSGLPVLWN
ncbi:MAG: hypothetical protein L6R42_009840, partial [Xanthoria sp. 1 TBL-2021]